MQPTTYTAIGLMSGTSADGIDAAIITTDGEAVIDVNRAHYHLPYNEALRQEILDAMAGKGDILVLEQKLTHHHAEAVRLLLDHAEMPASAIDVIGFHGQTLKHLPQQRLTLQIGNGAQLAHETGCKVVCDFRRNDVAAGGQGAPLVPIYHQGISADVAKPVVFINIGGVSNMTYIGQNGELLACDTGPGNALLDDWIYRHTGNPCDINGEIAASGHTHTEMVDRWLEHPYFAKPLPKSLDRNDFSSLTDNNNLTLADGAATLTAFTASAIAKTSSELPKAPEHYYICGGGRHNPVLMRMLAEKLAAPVSAVESIGFDGDMLEAQAFAYLAVRRLRQLPITFPQTTGIRKALAGGAVYLA
jgi:anhydro-N-acetylmuramic acid kinase